MMSFSASGPCSTRMTRSPTGTNILGRSDKSGTFLTLWAPRKSHAATGESVSKRGQRNRAQVKRSQTFELHDESLSVPGRAPSRLMHSVHERLGAETFK